MEVPISTIIYDYYYYCYYYDDDGDDDDDDDDDDEGNTVKLYGKIPLKSSHNQ